MNIKHLEPKQKRYTVKFDNGLYLRVHPSGKKSWVLRVPQNGKTVDITLGNYPEVSEKQAIQQVRNRKKEYELKPPKGATVKDAFALWCKHKKNLISFKDEKARVHTHIISKIGNLQLDEITPPMIMSVVKPLESKLPTLKRVLLQVNKMFSLSAAMGYITHNPCTQLSSLFKPHKVKAMPSINWKNLHEVMADMLNAPKKYQLLFAVSLYTLLRPCEVVSLRYDWIKDGVIEIPAEVMKMKRAFRLPVTDQLRDLLQECKEYFGAKNKKVFPNVSKQALARYLNKNGYKNKLVAHGIRSIGRNWMADNNVNYDVAEMCLAHITGSATVQAYVRTDYLDLRKVVMKEWHEYIKVCASRAEELNLNRMVAELL